MGSGLVVLPIHGEVAAKPPEELNPNPLRPLA